MSKLRIYISGKISGKEEEAKHEFAKASEDILARGFVPVNPFYNGLDGKDSWERHLAVDILTLLGCDAIYQLPGWELSQGARLENEVAMLAGIPVCKTRSQKENDEKVVALLNTPITQIWVPGSSLLASRLVNTLQAAGIQTLADIVLFTRAQFMRIRNVGGHIMASIETYLYDSGLSFGMSLYRYGVSPGKEALKYYETNYEQL